MLNTPASLRSDPAVVAGSTFPVLHWDGRSPVALIARVETRLAAGTRFVVLSTAGPCGAGADRAFLEGWWRAARARVDGLCAGWAMLAPGRLSGVGTEAVETVPEFADFPIRLCPDRADALWWLNARLAETASPRSLQ